MLTIAAQLAVMLRARIGSGKLAVGRPIPGESTLVRQYGVAPETAHKAVRALVAEGLVYVVAGRGAYVVTRDCRFRPSPGRTFSRSPTRTTPSATTSA
jgi:DNA-binding GntR family transcriptional regulator